MEKTVLIVTAVEGAENLARALSREADAVVEPLGCARTSPS